MNKYGQTLRKIRESLNISQSKISESLMSQSNYSKVENDEIDISFLKMMDLLENLGMTVDEFIYIHDNYRKNPNRLLNRMNQIQPGDRKKIIENIDELKAIINPTQREEEILAIFEALESILNNDYQTANEQVLRRCRHL